MRDVRRVVWVLLGGGLCLVGMACTSDETHEEMGVGGDGATAAAGGGGGASGANASGGQGAATGGIGAASGAAGVGGAGGTGGAASGGAAGAISELRAACIETVETDFHGPDDWDDACAWLQSHGFTDVIANLAFAGGAFYESEILPPWWTVASYGEQLGPFVDAAHRHGLRAHVWIVAFNASYGTTDAARQQIRAQDGFALLWEISSQSLKETADVWGNQVTWMNYNSPWVRQRLADIAAEIVRLRPDVDGINLDYFRSPGSVASYNDSSRIAFGSETGIEIDPANWPADVMVNWLFDPDKPADGPYAAAYAEWQSSNVSAALTAVRNAVQASMDVSVDVFADPDTASGHQQPWATWAGTGQVNMLFPMNYAADASEFDTMVARQLEVSAGRTPIYPLVPLYTDEMTVESALQMIEVTRVRETGGFGVYRYDYMRKKDFPVLP